MLSRRRDIDSSMTTRALFIAALVGCGARAETPPVAKPLPTAASVTPVVPFSEGSPCDEDGHTECAPGKQGFVTCKAQHWRLTSKCAGPLGCYTDAQGRQFCDESIADVGEPCAGATPGICTRDKTTLLECRNAVMVVASTCRGPRGCSAAMNDDPVRCDTTIAEVGDACKEDFHSACSADGKTMTLCRAGAVVKERDCKTGCVASVTDIVCR
jgi:hypothetical protein